VWGEESRLREEAVALDEEEARSCIEDPGYGWKAVAPGVWRSQGRL
jgi:hypothetical protein